MDRNIQLLGIAKKAGLLAVGGDAVSIAARERKAKLVLSASDASERAIRRARINAKTGGAVYIAIPYTRFELGNVTGRGSPGTVAVLDIGLAAGFTKGLLAETGPDRYGKAAEQLAEQARVRTEAKKSTQSRKRRTTI